MDETVPPYTDINGSWHVKFETIMKCFSEENLEKELDELLKLNNISKDSGKVNLDKWKLANAENVKYHNMLATDIVSNTWGTRVRSVGPEENWKYKTKQEKWIQSRIKDPVRNL